MDEEVLSRESQSERKRLLFNTLMALAAAGLIFYLMPWAFFLFGVGAFAWVFTALCVFFLLLLFYRTKVLPQQADDIVEEFLQRSVEASPTDLEVGKALLENALHLEEVKVRDCMAPRNEVVFVDVLTDMPALRAKFVESGLSRILVAEDEDLDRALGYVHVQQVIQEVDALRPLILPMASVPESLPVSELLDRFIRTRSNIFSVMDEYGSLSGIVTLEDALEQLFGEIEDEYDEEEFVARQISEREYLLSGRLKVSQVNEKFPTLQIPEGDYNTLSGYIVTETQTIPEQGARIVLGDRTFCLESVSNRRIELVRVLL